MLGVKRINSLTEDTKQARDANAIYEFVKDECLVEHNWNFAKERVSLGAPLSDTPLYEFTYQFTLPNNCLRVVWTNLGDSGLWKVEGRKLLCNSNSVYIEYIKGDVSPNEYSPQFAKYLSLRLAEQLAFPTTASRTLEADMAIRADKFKNNAFGLDSVEGIPDDLMQEDWRTERY